MIKRIIINILGRIGELFYKSFCRYQVIRTCKKLGAFGESSMLSYPFVLQGTKYIFIGKHVSIRQGAVLTAINAKILIKRLGYNSYRFGDFNR